MYKYFLIASLIMLALVPAYSTGHLDWIDLGMVETHSISESTVSFTLTNESDQFRSGKARCVFSNGQTREFDVQVKANESVTMKCKIPEGAKLEKIRAVFKHEH